MQLNLKNTCIERFSICSYDFSFFNYILGNINIPCNVKSFRQIKVHIIKFYFTLRCIPVFRYFKCLFTVICDFSPVYTIFCNTTFKNITACICFKYIVFSWCQIFKNHLSFCNHLQLNCLQMIRNKFIGTVCQFKKSNIISCIFRHSCP